MNYGSISNHDMSPIPILSSLAGVRTIGPRHPPLEPSTGRILSAWEQEEHRATIQLGSQPAGAQKKKRKGTGTTVVTKRSNTLASVSSRVDDLAQQIGDFIKSQAAATPAPLSQVPSLPQAPPASQGSYVMPPPPSAQAHHHGFMWAQPPAQSHGTVRSISSSKGSGGHGTMQF
ncbi:hypothetical protein HRG_013188 [Hirsutella rhossiliensis]